MPSRGGVTVLNGSLLWFGVAASLAESVNFGRMDCNVVVVAGWIAVEIVAAIVVGIATFHERNSERNNIHQRS